MTFPVRSILSALFSVIRLAHETLPEQYSPSLFTTLYESFPQGFFIAVSSQKIIGFLIGIQTSSTKAKVLMLSVDKPFRKQGIGSALLTSFLTAMKTHGICSITLEVRTTNISAIGFYQTHGFTITDTIKGFYQNGSMAYSMYKQLQSN